MQGRVLAPPPAPRREGPGQWRHLVALCHGRLKSCGLMQALCSPGGHQNGRRLLARVYQWGGISADGSWQHEGEGSHCTCPLSDSSGEVCIHKQGFLSSPQVTESKGGF